MPILSDYKKISNQNLNQNKPRYSRELIKKYCTHSRNFLFFEWIFFKDM